MTTYVLVPGFWLGSWAWDEVATELRAGGHQVHAVTPAGVGERAGEPGVTIEDQVTDLVAALRASDGDPVVLVGHSGGGPVVAAAAERARDRVAALVFVDTGPLPGDIAHIDFVGPEAAEAVRRSMAANGGDYPMPALVDFGPIAVGLTEQIRARSTPEPGGVVLRAAARAADPDHSLPKVVVACTFGAADVRAAVAAGAPAFAEMAGPEWTIRELPTGHWPMFSEPAALAGLLAEVRAGTPAS